MSYIVVYQRPDGSSGLEECETLDLAVVAAERLRNVDSVESPRIFKTEEVKFDFRPYYRVEVSGGADSPTPDTSTPDSPTPGTATDSVETTSPLVAPVVESTTPPPPPTAPVSESSSSTSSIDPWASASSIPASIDSLPPAPTDTDPADLAAAEPIDYANTSTDVEPDVAEAVPAPTPDTAASTGDEEVVHADASRGLFSTASLPESPADGSDLDKLAEDVSDAVPPRRGLFGR